MAKDNDKIFIAELADVVANDEFLAFYSHTWGVVTNNDYTGIVHADFQPENMGLVSDAAAFDFQSNKRRHLKVDTVAEVISI